MKFELETIGCGLLLPAALSVVVMWTLLRTLPRDVAPRFAGAVGCAVGFFAGYALLEPRHLRPSTYWQWLPWLGIIAAIAGPIGLVSRVPSVGRWTLWLVVSVVSAWLLVPTWADLGRLESIARSVRRSLHRLRVFADGSARQALPADVGNHVVVESVPLRVVRCGLTGGLRERAVRTADSGRSRSAVWLLGRLIS